MSLGTQYLVTLTVLFGPSTAQCIYSSCVCTCHDYKLVWIVLFTDISAVVYFVQFAVIHQNSLEAATSVTSLLFFGH